MMACVFARMYKEVIAQEGRSKERAEKAYEGSL
jgi:hypothetical protein